ncbi:nutrient deprivation-induced protein [Neorhizobium sp. NPDC001467]|uniref:nutrient deprivation-induced protein n=1 Tax=Neorhizobium sp. NPDC001467 TaxID=3390595 RepID=UPI003CFE19A1
MISPQETGPGSTTSELKQKISDDIQSVSDYAGRAATNISDDAKDAATEQKNVLANKLAGVADALEKVSSELESGDHRDIGHLTRNLGTNLRSASRSIEDRSLSEIAGMAEDFGRKQPLAFLSMAAIAGLAASRFLTSSAPKSAASTRDGAVSGQLPASRAPSTSVAPTSLTTTEGRAYD